MLRAAVQGPHSNTATPVQGSARQACKGDNAWKYNQKPQAEGDNDPVPKPRTIPAATIVDEVDQPTEANSRTMSPTEGSTHPGSPE